MNGGPEEASSAVLWTFALYMGGVFVLAWLSNRSAARGGFLSDYFLGGRGFGAWAVALTFAATAASGGSFMGFPSLIYTHGWVLALWIAGYMVVPLVSMALMGKRLNQVSRRAGAITVPEILRERFASRTVGGVATFLIVLFLFFYLLAQFKAGSEILNTLLSGTPAYDAAVAGTASLTSGLPWVGTAEPDYLLCLIVFGIAVVAYVTYGGFRAVVWTDVMQGVVMAGGLVVLLVLTLGQVGGLENASRRLAEMTPPVPGTGLVVRSDAGGAVEDLVIARGEWLVGEEDGKLYRLAERVLVPAGKTESEPAEAIQIQIAEREQGAGPELHGGAVAEAVRFRLTEARPYAQGAVEKGAYLKAPGPHATQGAGFLALGMAFSFFVFWPFGGVGQPSSMVRMMIFDHTRVLRHALVLVTLYFSFTYVALVLVFVCARVLLPGMEYAPDRVMPEMARYVTAASGVPWLAGLVVAAPFAAVMSSVDSFLLVVASAVVRDFYQRDINPRASEKTLRRLSHGVTLLVGGGAMVIAMHPPEFLQVLIVFASAGLAAGFLVPMFLCLYWQRMTAAGAVAGMLSGCGMHLALYLIGWARTGKFQVYELLGVQPFLWDLVASIACCVGVSLLTPPPDGALVRKYFARQD